MPLTGVHIETERLLLRDLCAEDAAAIQEMASDREIALNTLSIPHPYPPGAAAEFIERTQRKRDDGSACIVAVILRTADALIGTAGLVIDKQHNRADLGYWIGVEHWGKGYATEAARAVLGFGFDELGLDRVHACFFPRNPSSGRVLEKIGMTAEGRLRQHVLKWDKRLDCVMMAMLRSEWEVRKADA